MSNYCLVAFELQQSIFLLFVIRKMASEHQQMAHVDIKTAVVRENGKQVTSAKLNVVIHKTQERFLKIPLLMFAGHIPHEQGVVKTKSVELDITARFSHSFRVVLGKFDTDEYEQGMRAVAANADFLISEHTSKLEEGQRMFHVTSAKKFVSRIVEPNVHYEAQCKLPSDFHLADWQIFIIFNETGGVSGTIGIDLQMIEQSGKKLQQSRITKVEEVEEDEEEEEPEPVIAIKRSKAAPPPAKKKAAQAAKKPKAAAPKKGRPVRRKKRWG